MNVFKFGGASVKDVAGVKNLVSVLNTVGQQKTLIVVSAMGKTTNMLEKIIDEVKARLPICYIEKHDDSDYLLYNRDTEEFVCQGSSLEELAEKCKERFDSVLVKAHEGAYWFVDGKVKEITE